MQTYLCQCGLLLVAIHARLDRVFAADLKIKVDKLVSERRELVAEAELVFSLDIGRPREAVVLFLSILVEDSIVWRRQLHIHVVITARDNLHKNKPTKMSF